MIHSSKEIKKVIHPDRILSYFKLEFRSLTLVTLSGVIYNVGMIAGPYFEGRLTQCLFNIMRGTQGFTAMLPLTAIYLVVILVVQLMRCIKRFYVRKFDTGVVLVAYLTMLFYYDWRLTLISCAFTPVAYFIAGRLKHRVAQYNADYKKSAGRLNSATMDRVSGTVTYRVYGCEENRDHAYEAYLTDYEKRAVAANFWENTMQPLYHIISMCGVVFILYLGGKNVLGTGFCNWDIAAFTTFLLYQNGAQVV